MKLTKGLLFQKISLRTVLIVPFVLQPDLIFMDMRMPEMDGYQAIAQIKSSTTDQSCVIIAVTARVLEEEKEAVLSAGCDDFIKKPIRDSDIWEALERHLGVEFIYEEIPSA